MSKTSGVSMNPTSISLFEPTRAEPNMQQATLSNLPPKHSSKFKYDYDSIKKDIVIKGEVLQALRKPSQLGQGSVTL